MDFLPSEISTRSRKGQSLGFCLFQRVRSYRDQPSVNLYVSMSWT